MLTTNLKSVVFKIPCVDCVVMKVMLCHQESVIKKIDINSSFFVFWLWLWVTRCYCWCIGWFDTVIVSCLVSSVHFSCIVQYSLYHNMAIGTMCHCALVSSTPSQSIELVLGCALFWRWVSLGAPVTSLIELYFIMIFIMIVVTIIGIFMVIHYFLNYTLGLCN